MGQDLSKARVYPFTYQSNNIAFGEWISLFTLSLAPLLAHVAAGAPHATILSRRRKPRWHDLMVLYNPTTIIWRYAAIADRRIRAREWSAQDMAACNALFWTDRGWDGSEDMVVASLPHCVSLPSHARAELFHWQTLTTIIITLQGCHALYALAGGFDTAMTGLQDSTDLVFFPLAIIGVLRLFAAGWLTDDYVYTLRDSTWTDAASYDPLEQVSYDSSKPEAEGSSMTTATIPEDPLLNRDRYKPTSYTPSVMFRALYMIIVCGLWIVSFFRATPLLGGAWERSATTFVQGIVYLFLMTVTCVTYLWYLWRCGTTSAIIPCVSRNWYKVYTVVLWSMMLGLFVVACCETTKLPCGKYTSLGKEYWDGRTDCKES